MITLQENVHGAIKPSGWHLSKLHQILTVCKGNKNAGMKENNLLSLSYGRIKRKDINSPDGLLPASFETYQIVEPENIVMRLTDLQNDKRSLRQGLVQERGIITSAYDALKVTKSNHSGFWFYTLLALDLAKYYYSLGGGVRQSINFSDFPNDWVYYPGKETQRDIANFLDKETTRIDLLINKKLLTLKLLVERYCASFNEHHKFSPRIRFEHVTTQIFRAVNKTKIKTVVPIGLYNRGRGIFLKQEANISELGDSSFYFIEQDDLIFSGQFSWEGAVALASQAESGCVASHRYPIFVPKQGVNNAFLFAFFRTEYGQFILNDCSRGSAGRNRPLNINLLNKWKIPIPTIDQQTKIKKLVEQEQIVKQSILKSILKLEEYRIALITAAVTGQIDVTSYGKFGTVDRHLDKIQNNVK